MKTVDPFAAKNAQMSQESLLAFIRRVTWELPDRRLIMGAALLGGVLFVALLTLVLDPDGRAAQIVLDRRSPHFPYPFTIQNIEHLIFFIGLGELYARWRCARFELKFLNQGLLPEDEETVLEMSDLGPIRKRVAGRFTGEHGILPSLIDLSILQFNSGRSIDQTVSVMNSSLELIQHRVDLSYGLIRYIAWVIPTMGFIGTVIGIGAALASVPSGGEIEMSKLAQELSVGFDCTMVALVQSAILVFILHIVQEREELGVNLAGTYILRNLVNRLYTQPAPV